MKGTRPLNNEEIRKVRDTFTGLYEVRNRSFFMLGVSIGGRVSELLALTVGDVWQNKMAVTDFQFDRQIVKGKETARTVPVNVDGRKAIEDIIAWHKSYFDDALSLERPLFVSREKTKNGKYQPIKRQAMHKILKAAFIEASLNGKLATHTLRKTFAQRVYQKCNDIFIVKELLGHRNVSTTQAYIGVNYVTVRDAVEAMSLDAEINPKHPLDAYKEGDLIAYMIEKGYAVRKQE